MAVAVKVSKAIVPRSNLIIRSHPNETAVVSGGRRLDLNFRCLLPASWNDRLCAIIGQAAVHKILFERSLDLDFRVYGVGSGVRPPG